MEKLDSDDYKKVKEIYNESVKLIEMLSVLVSKISAGEVKVPPAFINEVCTQCFAVGASLYDDSVLIASQDEDEEDSLEELDSYDDWKPPYGSCL